MKLLKIPRASWVSSILIGALGGLAGFGIGWTGGAQWIGACFGAISALLILLTSSVLILLNEIRLSSAKTAQYHLDQERIREKESEALSQGINAKLSKMMNDLVIEQMAWSEIQKALPTHLPSPSIFTMKPVNLLNLMRVVEDQSPKTVVELGSGLSTLVLAKMLRSIPGSRLVSIDHDLDRARRCQADLDRNGLSSIVQLIHAPLRKFTFATGEMVDWYDPKTFPKERLGEIDLLIIDGPPAMPGKPEMTRAPALPVFYSLLSARATIFLDDGNREGEKKVVQWWSERFKDLTFQFSLSTTGYWIARRQLKDQNKPVAERKLAFQFKQPTGEPLDLS